MAEKKGTTPPPDARNEGPPAGGVVMPGVPDPHAGVPTGGNLDLDGDGIAETDETTVGQPSRNPRQKAVGPFPGPAGVEVERSYSPVDSKRVNMRNVQDVERMREAYLARCRMVAEGVKALTEAGMGETSARELAVKIFEKMCYHRD